MYSSPSAILYRHNIPVTLKQEEVKPLDLSGKKMAEMPTPPSSPVSLSPPTATAVPSPPCPDTNARLVDMEELWRTYYLISLRNYSAYISTSGGGGFETPPGGSNGLSSPPPFAAYTSPLQAGYNYLQPQPFSYSSGAGLPPPPLLKRAAKRTAAKGTAASAISGSSPALKKRRMKSSSGVAAAACSCRFCYEDHIMQMRNKKFLYSAV